MVMLAYMALTTPLRIRNAYRTHLLISCSCLPPLPYYNVALHCRVQQTYRRSLYQSDLRIWIGVVTGCDSKVKSGKAK